jgi:hypothetical protein
MKINSDINILGGLPDLNLIVLFMDRSRKALNQGEEIGESLSYDYTAISTEKSVKRFEGAIRRNFLIFKDKRLELLFKSVITAESISRNSLVVLFWYASFNNDLLSYLNDHLFFPAYFSGRIGIRPDESIACLKELRESEHLLKSWSDYTLELTASKYLTLMKKFGLMEGTKSKTIGHPYLSDKMLILFLYWLVAVETKSNLLDSPWLRYCFSEKQVFIERIMQKKFSKFIEIQYTGDTLKVTPTIPYQEIYDATS